MYQQNSYPYTNSFTSSAGRPPFTSSLNSQPYTGSLYPNYPGTGTNNYPSAGLPYTGFVGTLTLLCLARGLTDLMQNPNREQVLPGGRLPVAPTTGALPSTLLPVTAVSRRIMKS